MSNTKIKVNITLTEKAVGSKIMDFFTRYDLSAFNMGNGLTRNKRLIKHLDNTLPEVEPEELVVVTKEKKCLIKKNISKKKIPSPNALNAGF